MNRVTIRDTAKGDEFVVDSSTPLKVYICGPTVYTASHIGHLKTYMTFDIIRRIMSNYFDLKMLYMMNITNVDDKIIKATYLQEYPDLKEEEYPLNLTEDMYLPTSKFEEYANRWEGDFFNVLESVNILPPDILSRVTEYIDEILEFVDEIDRNGYAFEHDGSVYFYGTKYIVDLGQTDSDTPPLNENENENEEIDPMSEAMMKDPASKHNFVLLKKAQPHEPGWDSKWGRIRPGWHIECSAMASSVFGDTIDIHGGGIDLSFPHHHNEVLQSNARFYPPNSDKSNRSWVEHFMHTGHLNIKGLKMSRSLKNFITIDEALKSNTADELRMLFLLHQWDAPMDYSDDTMRDAQHFVNFFQNFDKQVRSIMLRKNGLLYKKYGDREIEFADGIIEAGREIDQSLRANLNTPKVITILQNLINKTFQYVDDVESNENDNIICTQLVQLSHARVLRTLNAFGLTILQNESTDSKEEGLIKVVSDIRSDIRVIAKDAMKIARAHKDDPALKGEIGSIATSLYDMTDDIRDQKLKEIGIELTDK
jgi:cysteinyl-tRNA synthetase